MSALFLRDIQALRARHLAGLNQQPFPEEQAAGLDLLSQLLQQQGFSSGPSAPNLEALRSAAASEPSPGEPVNAADTLGAAEAGPAEDSAPELAAFLDDLLATPEDSMFAPQLAGEPLQFSGDPGKDPPPWQPLKPAQARLPRVPSIPASPPSKPQEARASKASSSPFLVAQEADSYNSAEERRKAAEAAAAASERARSRLSRGRVASSNKADKAAVGAVQGKDDDRHALPPAAVASTMLGARSQEVQEDSCCVLDKVVP